MSELFGSVSALVLGDLMIDRYLTGRVERISPEAPVPVVLLESEESRLGGAANVALNIKALGGGAFMRTVSGGDANSALLGELLRREGLSDAGIIYAAARRTTIKTRILAKHQQLLRVDEESTEWLDEASETALMAAIAADLRSAAYNVLILQDYNKGVLSERVIGYAIAEAKAQGIPVIVDPKEKNFFAYKGVSLFKPNLREVNINLKQNFKPNIDELQEADRLLREAIGMDSLIITLSEYGVYWSAADGSRGIIGTHQRQVADVCGAGDTVLSLCAAGLACGWGLEQLAQWANLAGGLVCEYAGVVPIDRVRLLSEAAALGWAAV